MYAALQRPLGSAGVVCVSVHGVGRVINGGDYGRAVLPSSHEHLDARQSFMQASYNQASRTVRQLQLQGLFLVDCTEVHYQVHALGPLKRQSPVLSHPKK